MSERAEKQLVQSRLYWRCRRKANVCAWIVSSVVGLLLIAGLAAGIGLTATNLVLGCILTIGTVALIAVTFGNLITGATVANLHGWVQTRCFTWLLRRESALTGLDLGEMRVNTRDEESEAVIGKYQ